MSRNIRNDHPWSDDEVEYVLARSGGQDLVDQNKDQYPPDSEPDAKPDDVELELSQEVYDHVRGLSIEEAQSELAKHNLSSAGDESELKIRLAQYLQDKKNKSS